MFWTTLNTRLIRVWRPTGNPAAPLAAVWLTAAQAATLTTTEGGLRRCA